MENENIAILAPRKNGEKSKKTSLSSLGLSTLVLLSDVIWFIVRRLRYDSVGWWEILFLVISGTFFFFSLIGLWFSSSSSKFSKKIEDEPLIAFDTIKNVFIVQSFYEFKAVELKKEDVISIKINPENDEAILNYLKDGKAKILNIGFGDPNIENELNSKIMKYKA